jgi:hypothetical protein
MELTLDWISKLRELIPDAKQRGALTTVLQNKSNEERRQIFKDDDDEAVRASLIQLYNDAMCIHFSAAREFVQSLSRCFAGPIDEAHAFPVLNN